MPPIKRCSVDAEHVIRFHLWTENFCSFFAPKVAFSNLSGIVWTRPELPIYFFLIQRVNDLQKKNCIFGSLSLLHLIGGTLATKLISAYMRARICTVSYTHLTLPTKLEV